MADEKLLHGLIRLIYECSADARQWPHFLASLSKATGDSCAVLAAIDAKNPYGDILATNEIDPLWMRRYVEYYARIDVRVQNSRHLWKPGKTIRTEAVIGHAALRKTEYYNDYMRPQQRFYSVACILTQEDSVTSMIDIGHRGQQPFPEAEHALLLELVPHLQTALRLLHRIAGLETRLESAAAAQDRLPGALIVTDSSGCIVHMNRRAEALLKSNRGLSATADGLSASCPSQTSRLREFIARTAGAVAGNGRHPGGMLQLQRTGHPPLKLQIAPLASSSGPARRRPAVAIFIADPEPTAQPDPAELGALLGLTPAEARLTAAIARGETLQQFADQAGVSLNTARTLLQRIFSKTGVSRQAELVRLALTCAGGPRWV